eukprot:TRINITY_DN1422_c0_g2_i13.p3 TRINITY_DN1422_c0_g2~~TRINITY_DN1422_c0_g2_i13.p3  ORF type:complete len:183 (-),score=11.35 TRINITY_DN1422_c0_g2_i13:635-1183(-)
MEQETGNSSQGQQSTPSSARQTLLLSAAGNLRDTVQRILKQRKPWAEVFDRTAFEKPANINEATTRLKRNSAYFRVNYIIFIALIILICFLASPSSLVILCALLAAWVYVFVVKAGPLVLGGRTFSEREKLIAMGAISFVLVFFLTSIASVLFYAIALSCILIAIHGAMRQPEDLFLEDQQV